MARYRVNLRVWLSRRRKVADWLGPRGILDLAPGATFAYGLRLLRASYSGKACNVRRGGDNATQDVGFDVFGNFDASGFWTFVNGGNGTGFVATWYDQSGNGINATQATLAKQPQITFQLNGHACLTTAGFATSQYLATATNSLLDFTGTGHSVFYALQYIASNDGGGTAGGRGDSLETICHFNSASFAGWAGDAGDTSRLGCTFVFTSNGTTFTHDGASTHLNPINDGNQHFTGWTFTSGTVTIYQDTNSFTSAVAFDTPTSSGQPMTILAGNDTTIDDYFSGNFGEGYGWARTLTGTEITNITANAEAYFASLPLTVLPRRKAIRQRQRTPIWAKNARNPKLHRRVWDLSGDQGPYWISNVLPRRKATQVRKRSWRGNARRPFLHRFPAWLIQQGAYWVSNTLARLKVRRRPHPIWRRNAWNPRLHRRVWDLSGDQGAYWVSNVPRQRAGLRRLRRYIWTGNARRPRLHRFPSWVFQQGAYWLRRKVKHFAFQPLLRRKRRFNAAWNVVAAAVSWLPKLRRRRPIRLAFLRRRTQQHRFPSWLVQQGPYWITNVPQRRKKLRTQPPAWVIPPKRHRNRFRVVFVYQFLLLVQQAWNWNAQAAKFTLSLGTVAKAWVWNGQAAVIGLTLATVSKAWAWAANAPLVSFSLGMVSKTWNWIARPPIVNLPVAVAGIFNIARGVVWGVIRGVLNRPRIGP